MRICDNGVYRDATPEEIEAFNNMPVPGSAEDVVSDAEAISAIKEALS